MRRFDEGLRLKAYWHLTEGFLKERAGGGSVLTLTSNDLLLLPSLSGLGAQGEYPFILVFDNRYREICICE